MNWLISIHLYLCRNSLRRWWEQPLSLLSKLVVSALLGMLGAVVILGTKHLGEQLDQRLRDENILRVVVSEFVTEDAATALLAEAAESRKAGWRRLDAPVNSVYQAGGFAETLEGRRVQVWAIANLAKFGFADDFYYLSDDGPERARVTFEISDHWSEATRIHPEGVLAEMLDDRPAIVAGIERLSPLLKRGFTRVSLIQARSIDQIERIHTIGDTLSRIENRRTVVRSNLRILRSLEQIRNLQAQALLGVALGSSAVLGLVFGSLAWMEFREERYLLSLMRSFGVGRLSLLSHSVAENVLLSVTGVAIGFAVLHFGVSYLDLQNLQLEWLRSTETLLSSEGRLLLAGAAAGGFLSCVPIAIALRKPLGLILN